MAVFPCDWSAHRYPQPQQAIYFTMLFGGEPETKKMRLCPTHLEDELALIRETMAQVDEDSSTSSICEQCDEASVGSIFAKVYRLKEEPVYWAVDLCARCYVETGHRLKVSNGRPLTGR